MAFAATIRIYALAALWVLSSASWVCADQKQASADTKNILQKIQQLVYTGYEKTPVDPKKMEEMKNQLFDAFDGRLDRDSIDHLLDVNDPGRFKSSWDLLKSKLPAGADWYVSASFDPIIPAADQKAISVICGVVLKRDRSQIKTEQSTAVFNNIFLEAGAVKDRKSVRLKPATWVLGNSTDIVVYQENLDESLKNWSNAREHYLKVDLEDERLRLIREEGAIARWFDVGNLLFAQHLIDCPKKELQKMWCDKATATALGIRTSLEDSDFMFVIQHVGLSEQEMEDVLSWRGWLTLLMRSDVPQDAVSIMAITATKEIGPGQHRSPSLLESLCLVELNYLGSALVGLRNTTGVPTEFKLKDTLLSKPIDREHIRKVARWQVPEMLAENNMRLISELGGKDISLTDPSDQKRLQSIAKRALQDFPDGDVVKMMAGEIFIQTGDEEQGEQLVLDIEKNCRADSIRSGAEQALGILSLKRRDTAAAIHWLELSRSKAPMDPPTLYFLCKAFVAAGKIEEARETRDQFLIVEPKGSRADELRKI